MKPLIAILLFTFSISHSQNHPADANQKILGKWYMEQYGNTSQSENQFHIQKTGGTDTIWATFNEDYTLDLVYSETKKEKYNWKIKGDKIQITAGKDGNKKSEIIGKFEMNFWRKDSELALFKDDGSYRAIKFKR